MVTEPVGTVVSNVAQRRVVTSSRSHNNGAGKGRMESQVSRALRPCKGKGQVTGTPTPSLVPYGPCPTQDGHETRADVVIVAHVLVLLLAPHQLCTWVLLCLLLDQVKGEWRDLGQTGRKGSVARGRGTTQLLLEEGNNGPQTWPCLAHCPGSRGWQSDLVHHSD